MIFITENFYPTSKHDVYFSRMQTKRQVLILSISGQRLSHTSIYSSSNDIFVSSSGGKTLSWGEA